MTKYVVGFMFDKNRFGVLLIQKKKPKWQFGKLNGVGGKIEDGESSKAAMIREFKEETGIDHKEWKYVITMSGSDWSVDVYSAFTDDVHDYQHLEDEMPLYIPLDELDSYDQISNLQWLIPMCLDKIDYTLSNHQQ